jgi:hypothetical protein
MGQWITERREALVQALAPKWRRAPRGITLSRILGDIDIDRLDACLSEYQQQLDEQDGVSGRVELADGRRLVGQSLDGKTLRGASKHGDDVHLVSRVRHESGIVLEQMRVPTKIDERKAAQRLLQGECMGQMSPGVRTAVKSVQALRPKPWLPYATPCSVFYAWRVGHVFQPPIAASTPICNMRCVSLVLRHLDTALTTEISQLTPDQRVAILF